MHNLIQSAQKIRLLILDVDGVLTNGELTYGANGITQKTFHVHDGQGIKLMQQSGVTVAIITAKNSPMVAQRMADLDVTHVYQGYADKLIAYADLKTKLNLTDEAIAYIGDDIYDLPLLKRVGLGITVANAPDPLHEHAHFSTRLKGGEGAVREVCDFIMKSQGTYQQAIDIFLKR